MCVFPYFTSTGLASSSSASQEEGVPSTPSKATSTASKATVQTRLHLQLSKIVETARGWDVNVPSHLDQKDLSPRWIIGGDLNVVPNSLSHGLVLTTSRGMPTAIASKRQIDGFIVDPLTARAFNPTIDLMNVSLPEPSSSRLSASSPDLGHIFDRTEVSSCMKRHGSAG